VGEVIHVDFAKLSSPPSDIWPEGVDPQNIISFEEMKRKHQRETSGINPDFTPQDLQKLEYFSSLLDYPGNTSTVVNTHYKGVSLPEQFMSNTRLFLNWSYKSGITDFQFDQWGVRGGMTFGGTPFFVEIPWTAIWQICKADDPGNSLKIWPMKEQVEE